MTSPVAIIGLTYDGVDVQEEDLDIFFEVTRGLNEAPEVRGVDTVVPSRAGRVPRARQDDVLRVVLKGHVRGSGADDAAQKEDYRANADTVRALFSPNREPADLVALAEDGSTRTLICRPIGSPMWNERVASLYADVSVELEAVDPPDWSVA